MGNIHSIQHRLTAITIFIIASSAFVVGALGGFSCSFVDVRVKSPDYVLITSWGEEIVDLDGSTSASSFGVNCLSDGDGDDGNTSTTTFYDESDRMWNMSRIFFFCAMACGGLTVLWSFVLTTCIIPTQWRWRGLSIMAAITAVLQVPIFLIFESDTCNYDINRQSCYLSTGAYLNIASISVWIILTLATQCIRPPRWDDEFGVWRTETHIRPTKSISVVRNGVAGCPTDAASTEGGMSSVPPPLPHSPATVGLSPSSISMSMSPPWPLSLDEEDPNQPHQQQPHPYPYHHPTSSSLLDQDEDYHDPSQTSPTIIPGQYNDGDYHNEEEEKQEVTAVDKSSNCLNMSTMCVSSSLATAAVVAGNAKKNRKSRSSSRSHRSPRGVFSADDVYGDSNNNNNEDSCSIDLSRPTSGIHSERTGGDGIDNYKGYIDDNEDIDDVMSATDHAILNGVNQCQGFRVETNMDGMCHDNSLHGGKGVRNSKLSSSNSSSDQAEGVSNGDVGGLSISKANAKNNTTNPNDMSLSNISHQTPPGFKVSCVYPDGTRHETRFTSCIDMTGKIQSLCPFPESYYAGSRRGGSKTIKKDGDIDERGGCMDVPDDWACGDGEENESMRMDYLTRRMRSDVAAANAERQERRGGGGEKGIENGSGVVPFDTIEIDMTRKVKSTVGLTGVEDRSRSNRGGGPLGYRITGGNGGSGGVQQSGPPGYHADDVSEMTKGSGLASGVSDVLDAGQNATFSILEDLARPN
jgi:hypothetical protein